MRKTPILSLMIFALTGLIYVAQIFPITGVWLMMVGGPYWSVVTINVAFILMAVESLFGACPKKYVIFPLIYFGGYFATAGASHYQYQSLQSKVVEHNASVKIPFDPKVHDLVIAPGMSVAPFLTIYGLEEVYTLDPNDKSGKSSVAFIGGRKVCHMPVDFGLEGASVTSIRERKDAENNSLIERLGTVVKDICLIKMPKNPDGEVFTVKVRETDAGSLLLPMKKRDVEITSPEGKTYLIKGGSAAPFNELPAPYMGCATNLESGSWECFHGFLREGFQSLNKSGYGSLGDFAAIAKALGLRYVPIDKKYKPADADAVVEKIVEERLEAQKIDAYKRFDELIADPVKYKGDMDFSVIMTEQEFFIKNSVSMIEALTKVEAHFIETGASDSLVIKKREFLTDALSMLPLEVLKWHTPLLIELYSPATEKMWTWNGTRSLAIRTGDLGEGFYPLYKEILEQDSPYFPRNVVFAVCRAGPPVRSFVGKALVDKLKELKETPEKDAQKRAVYIALARIGLKGEAEKIIPFMKLLYIRDGDEKISYKSPPSVCVGMGVELVFP